MAYRAEQHGWAEKVGRRGVLKPAHTFTREEILRFVSYKPASGF